MLFAQAERWLIRNGAQPAEEPDQAGDACQGRHEAGPAERRADRGHREGYHDQQCDPPPRDQGAARGL